MEDERKSLEDTAVTEYRAETDAGYTDKTREDTPHAGEEYYSLPGARGRRSLLFSLLSIILSVLSICLFTYYIPALILAVAAIVLSVISRVRLGYFDRLSLVGFTLAIFGAVFGIGAIVMDCLGVLDKLFV
ncbi:MAG: hypothetical protein IKA64_05200 [Clostridia bacterium]|nr:hypothetical protein [Clostridia bacterium]